jgi:hypothetical protein
MMDNLLLTSYEDDLFESYLPTLTQIPIELLMRIETDFVGFRLRLKPHFKEDNLSLNIRYNQKKAT